MSEEEAITAAAAELALEEQKETDYQPPAVKSIDDILKTDEEDESLKKYKVCMFSQNCFVRLERLKHYYT